VALPVTSSCTTTTLPLRLISPAGHQLEDDGDAGAGEDGGPAPAPAPSRLDTALDLVSSMVYDEVMKAILRVLTEIDLSVCFKSGQVPGEGAAHCMWFGGGGPRGHGGAWGACGTMVVFQGKISI
jgi:hypothetical protein